MPPGRVLRIWARDHDADSPTLIDGHETCLLIRAVWPDSSGPVIDQTRQFWLRRVTRKDVRVRVECGSKMQLCKRTRIAFAGPTDAYGNVSHARILVPSMDSCHCASRTLSTPSPARFHR